MKYLTFVEHVYIIENKSPDWKIYTLVGSKHVLIRKYFC